MNPKKNIRIVKKGQREIVKTATAKSETSNSQSLRQTTREVAGNVAAWVKEFQQRSTHDPRRAFASLFVKPASV